jgi:hypothetical protein
MRYVISRHFHKCINYITDRMLGVYRSYLHVGDVCIDAQVLNTCIKDRYKNTQYKHKSYSKWVKSFAVCTLDARLLTRSQYTEGPATGHLDIGFSWFPCVYKRMLRWFPIFQIATTCFSCSPPDINVNLLVISFIYLYTCKITTATGWQPNCS